MISAAQSQLMKLSFLLPDCHQGRSLWRYLWTRGSSARSLRPRGPRAAVAAAAGTRTPRGRWPWRPSINWLLPTSPTGRAPFAGYTTSRSHPPPYGYVEVWNTVNTAAERRNINTAYRCGAHGLVLGTVQVTKYVWMNCSETSRGSDVISVLVTK